MRKMSEESVSTVFDIKSCAQRGSKWNFSYDCVLHE